METLQISDLRTDGGTQPRATLDGPTVMEYAETMERGVELPPVKVMHDGKDYWLYDGFHRVKAAQNIGRTTIRAEVEKGTRNDAQWASLAANKDHGLRRTQADKRRAIKQALKGWGAEYSDNQIAKHLGVAQSTVSRYRRSLNESLSQAKRTGADGRTIDTTNIGRPKKPDKPKPSPSSTEAQPAPGQKPMQTGSPSRRRRREVTRGEPEWDDDFDASKANEEEPRTQNEIVQKYCSAASSLGHRKNVRALRDFADRQHEFTAEQRAEVRQTAGNAIAALQRIVDLIK